MSHLIKFILQPGIERNSGPVRMCTVRKHTKLKGPQPIPPGPDFSFPFLFVYFPFSFFYHFPSNTKPCLHAIVTRNSVKNILYIQSGYVSKNNSLTITNRRVELSCSVADYEKKQRTFYKISNSVKDGNRRFCITEQTFRKCSRKIDTRTMRSVCGATSRSLKRYTFCDTASSTDATSFTCSAVKCHVPCLIYLRYYNYIKENPMLE